MQNKKRLPNIRVRQKEDILLRTDTTIYPTPISASYFSIDFDNGEFTRAAADARIAFEYCLLSHSHARRTRRTLLSQYVATFLSPLFFGTVIFQQPIYEMESK